jgi:replicative DNA helicase
VLRRLISAAGQIASVAYSEPDADAAISEAHRLIRQASTRRAGRDSRPIEAVIDELLDSHLRAMEQDAPIGLQYGLSALRKWLTGLLPGELLYIAGRPGSGKSALVATLAWQEGMRRAMEGAGAVEYITLEMKATQVAQRILAGFAELDTRIMRASFKRPDGTIDAAAWAAFRKTAMDTRTRLYGRLRFWDTPIQPSQIRAQLERAVSERDCRVAFIDYIGLISPDVEGKRREDEYQRLTNISRELKQLALELNIPIVCLAQMNRQSEHRPNPRPMMADIRDSGGLEQDGDFILGIYRGAEYMPKLAEIDERFRQLMELIVIKGRDTAKGFTIPLRFEGPYTRVSDWPHEWEYRSYLTLTPTDDDMRARREGGD